jgi:hypothetical protein
MAVQPSLGKKQDTISKITREIKGWRCGSSGKAPACIPTPVKPTTKKKVTMQH